ncbi:hypothetical protein PsorP6_010908 [Peronosclerospora sorghi]|uniref:Uncharacterized protein n=1 Tax=Peronosclerospora sorghi TaxID=230839 RepID=A0ACC0VY86_9STRA|nr:hypothetical protein PsorP6_010908 [Peronosclerospora sorghi]
MLYATGMTEEDMNKAQVGIASMWWEGNPCNMHLLDLAGDVKKGVNAAGLVGLLFNIIGVSDGISNGTDGMSYSLQSRDLIADSIETIMGGQCRAGYSSKGETLEIVSAFQAYGEYIAGRITEEERHDIIRHACPGAGACGGMYTANTMATAIETLDGRSVCRALQTVFTR